MRGLTILLALLASLTSTIHAGPITNAGAIGLFYGYSSFCAHPKQPVPPPGTVHMCIDSNDGPPDGIADSRGTVQVFCNPADKNQFAIVLFSPKDAFARVKTAHRDVIVDRSDVTYFPECARFQLTYLDAGLIETGIWCPAMGNFQLNV